MIHPTAYVHKPGRGAQPLAASDEGVVGINELQQAGIVGDVDFVSVREVAGGLTPIPGGVPLTNILSLKQGVEAAWQEVDNACFYHIQVLLQCRASATLHDAAHCAFMALPPPMTLSITLS